MKYIRTKDGRIVKVGEGTDIDYELGTLEVHNKAGIVATYEPIEVLRETDNVEELCDCFVKIKRKGNCKPYILKFDYKDLPTLKEQAIKYKDSPVYGAIHIENKGLIYVAKMNDKGELELL